MTARFSRSPGFRRAAMLAIAVTLVPLPLAAADRVAAPPAQAAQPLRTSIAKHAAREVLVSASAKPAPQNAARPRSATRQQSNNPQGGSFFKSPAGIACLAVIALGTGYALYSASNDRIHSVAREGQK